MKFFIAKLLVVLLPLGALAQISGTVVEIKDGQKIPLLGANVYWEGTDIGVTTNSEGFYTINTSETSKTLAASFIGYHTQKKIIISRQGTTDFTLSPASDELGTVEVHGKSHATTVDLKKAELNYKINSKELRKAPCCNLAESFETNASVDASFTDAVTGQKQIEMLGLSGKYALIQRENIPFARGLNANTGLSFIPGPFVESIQLTKGLSSVTNGFESITGQINVEFYKPQNMPKLYLNAYSNIGGRMELNALSGFKVNDKWSSAVLAHASQTARVNDVNNDGFTDIPTGNQLNFINRWQYQGTNGWESQMGILAIGSEKKGGQVEYVKNGNPSDTLWGYNSRGTRFEAYAKLGHAFKIKENKKGNKPEKSIGFILNYSFQDKDATYGKRQLQGEQNSLYFNAIFQNDWNKKNTVKIGASFQMDKVSENLENQSLASPLYLLKRTESTPGAFVEYTNRSLEKLLLVAGTRVDYNGYFEEFFITPRFNLKYTASEKTTLRLGGGRGQRTPFIINENQNILASSRQVNFSLYDGLAAEVAWNVGASISQNVLVKDKTLKLNADAFYTYFTNQLVADLDFDSRQAYLINSEGSRSFSFLAQADYELVKSLDVRLAYKYLNSQSEFIGGLETALLIPTHRAFANLGYENEKGWKFDLTLNWFGEKRLANTESSPVEFQQESHSDDFFTLNAQVNKSFKKGLEVFIGVDNLLDYRQKNPIVNANNPNDPYFDSQFTWAPIFGRNIYAGLYYSLDKKKKK